MNALRQTTPGNLLSQGLVGGALGGFVYVFLFTLLEGNSAFGIVLSRTPRSMVMGSMVGVIEATSILVLYRSTAIQLRAAMRVSFASVIATLIVFVTGVQLNANESNFTPWLLTTMTFLVPPALLIDSRFSPRELFTFGSIAVRDVGFDEIYESTNVWAIAGTLPLRFLSLGATGLLLLYIACMPKAEATLIGVAIVGGLPLLYLGISAFLTFKSPGKLLLLLLGIGGNIPVILGGLLSFSIYCSFPSMQDLLVLTKICCAFLITWAIFLFARLSVDTSGLMPLSILADKRGFTKETGW